jgi:hypothetical protein
MGKFGEISYWKFFNKIENGKSSLIKNGQREQAL